MVYRCLYHRGDFGDGLPVFYQCFSHVIGVYRSFPMETAGFSYMSELIVCIATPQKMETYH